MLQPFTYHLGNSEIKSTQGSCVIEDGVVTLKESSSSWPTILVVKDKGCMINEVVIWQGCEKWWIFTHLMGEDAHELEHTSDGGLEPVLTLVRVKKNGQVIHKA